MLPSTTEMFETLRVKVTTLSPLHTGSHQQSLDKTEYLALGGRVYVLDQDRVFAKDDPLVNRMELERWLAGKPRSLTDVYLDRQREKKPTLDLAALSNYSVRENAGLRGDKLYRPFQRDGQHRPYLAGSSLKGALRNAWLYHYLDHHPNVLKELVEKIKDIIDDYRKNHKKRNKLLSDLERVIPEDYFRAGYTTDPRSRTGPQADLFRCLGIMDSPSLDNNWFAAEEVQVLCDFFDGPVLDRQGVRVLEFKTDMVQECLQENREFNVTLRLNRKLLSFYLSDNDPQGVLQSLAEWLAAADRFFRRLWQHELNFFAGVPDSNYRAEARDIPVSEIARFYRTKLPEAGQGWLIRLGAGSGILGVTPDLRLEPQTGSDHDEEYLWWNDDNTVFDQIGYYAFWREQDKAAQFPKSRKLIRRQSRAGSGIVFPPGWLWLQPAEQE